MKEQLQSLVDWINRHGRIENHGHRRPGSACEECRVLNAAEQALADQPAATESGPHEVHGHTFPSMTEDCVRCGCKRMHRFGLECQSEPATHCANCRRAFDGYTFQCNECGADVCGACQHGGTCNQCEHR